MMMVLKGQTLQEQALQERNQHIAIKSIADTSAFARYGRVLSIDCADLAEMIAAASAAPAEPGYRMSESALEETRLFTWFQDRFYGGMPVQAGICTGYNTQLNCFEYHRGTEINIAAIDFVLLLAHMDDIHDNRISSERAEAFYVPKGSCIALYETTLHFSPLRVGPERFICIVILPRGTNGALDRGTNEALGASVPLGAPAHEGEGALSSPAPKNPEDELLFMKNKWLIGHPDSIQVQSRNAFCGVTGVNITLKPLEGAQ